MAGRIQSLAIFRGGGQVDSKQVRNEFSKLFGSEKDEKRPAVLQAGGDQGSSRGTQVFGARRRVIIKLILLGV